jgi:hypothetical protein
MNASLGDRRSIVKQITYTLLNGIFSNSQIVCSVTDELAAWR